MTIPLTHRSGDRAAVQHACLQAQAALGLIFTEAQLPGPL